jgi:hypothetical protein
MKTGGERGTSAGWLLRAHVTEIESWCWHNHSIAGADAPFAAGVQVHTRSLNDLQGTCIHRPVDGTSAA